LDGGACVVAFSFATPNVVAPAEGTFGENSKGGPVSRPCVPSDACATPSNARIAQTVVLDSEQKTPVVALEPRLNKQRNPHRDSLFWAIYEIEHPKEAFLRPSAKNVEIETRVQIIDQLKKTPKRLKETSAKLTLEQTQGLFGAMLTAKEDRLDFCVAYSVYYNKHILLVYPKTYRLFSPTLDLNVEDDDHVIILHVTKDGKHVTYSAYHSPSKIAAEEIMRTRVTLLKAQSTYKTPELESIAERLGVPIRRVEDGKRRKKEDVYNDIRVVIHNDMEFVTADSWRKN
jgi:hypothetical protein